MLKVGLVGVGGISGSHIPAWDKMEDTELVALCDVRPEQMEKYPDKRHYTDFEEMLQKEQLDLVDICVPTYLHADYAVMALERNIHVLCEKPIALKPEEVQRVYGTAKAHNVRFMVAQVLRFWDEYEYLKDAYDTGRFGKLLSGTMERLGCFPTWSWDNWFCDEKRSGLVPYDLHIHDLDFLIYAFGQPKSVKSWRNKQDNQDSFHVVYDFDGFHVSADAAWYAPDYAFRAGYRFQFEKAVLELADGKLTVYEVGKKAYCPIADAAADAASDDYIPTTNAYANEIRYFTDCVEQGRDAVKVKPEELETVIRLLNAL